MKKLYTMVLAAALVGTFTSCDDFLDYTPTAVVDEDKAFSEPDKMVNSAYAMLGDCWYSYPFNLWPYGDLSSDDCLKGGGGTGDTGLNIALNYKGFDFSMFWQGVYDQDVYNNQKFQTDFWAITDGGSNKGTRLLDAWNTNNTGSSIPRLSTMNTADEGRASSYFVENGSYLKLRTLQVGYTIPSSILSKLKMTSARVYLSGQNLLTIKSNSLTCSDPENPNWNYPLSTSVSFGLQVGF